MYVHRTPYTKCIFVVQYTWHIELASTWCSATHRVDNIFIFIPCNIGSAFFRVRRDASPALSELTCNFKCLPCARAAGRLTTMPISFSHKIYEKSGYQGATDRASDTATALYSLAVAAYRELFMGDQIDWFDDNIGVSVLCGTAGRRRSALTRRASASVTIDYVCSYTSHTF